MASMRPTRPISSTLARLKAQPASSPRPVRPTRWVCTSTSGVMSTLITASSCAMSSPRAATSVATSTEQLRLAKRTSTWSRSRCSRSPCSASALMPCACSTSTRSRHCCLVLQKASVLTGRKWSSSRPTACRRSLFASPRRSAGGSASPLGRCASVTSCGSRRNFFARLLDAFGVGGREQQRLARLRRPAGDGGDVVHEAHVEHAVGLVEHQRVQRVELQARRGPGGRGCGPACPPRRARRAPGCRPAAGSACRRTASAP